MSRYTRRFALVVAGAALTTAPAGAQPHRHHHRAAWAGDRAARASAFRSDAPQAYGGYYGAGGWEAETNARLTAQAYREPGVTLELAPDSKQTATGGPSGGVPGFSGH